MDLRGKVLSSVDFRTQLFLSRVSFVDLRSSFAHGPMLQLHHNIMHVIMFSYNFYEHHSISSKFI